MVARVESSYWVENSLFFAISKDDEEDDVEDDDLENRRYYAALFAHLREHHLVQRRIEEYQAHPRIYRKDLFAEGAYERAI